MYSTGPSARHALASLARGRGSAGAGAGVGATATAVAAAVEAANACPTDGSSQAGPVDVPTRHGSYVITTAAPPTGGAKGATAAVLMPLLAVLSAAHGSIKTNEMTWHYGAVYWDVLAAPLMAVTAAAVATAQAGAGGADGRCARRPAGAPCPPPLRHILELGVWLGGTLRMLARMFPAALVVGVDIHPRSKFVDDGFVRVVMGSQDDPATLDKALEVLRLGAARDGSGGPPELVTDDGSHLPAHQVCVVCV